VKVPTRISQALTRNSFRAHSAQAEVKAIHAPQPFITVQALRPRRTLRTHPDSDRGGFGLVEILLSLVLLLMLIQVVGVGVASAYRAGFETERMHQAAQMAESAAVHRALGMDEEELSVLLRETWPTALVNKSVVEAKDENEWEQWELIPDNKEGTEIRLSFGPLPPSKKRRSP